MLVRDSSGEQHWVSPTHPVPVEIVGDADGDTETINVHIIRNTDGDTVQVTEENVTTGKTTVTNFSYEDQP